MMLVIGLVRGWVSFDKGGLEMNSTARACGIFPFGFSGQAFAGPVCIRCRIFPTYAYDGMIHAIFDTRLRSRPFDAPLGCRQFAPVTA